MMEFTPFVNFFITIYPVIVNNCRQLGQTGTFFGKKRETKGLWK